jgi:predicted glycosyltransferase
VDYKTCERLVKDLQINLVLSDHRYGFFSKKVPSIFLTHQCQLPTKNKWVQKLHHRFINTNFQSVWVFDTENHSFAHELSDTKNIEPPVSYLGAVSRFENYLPSTKDKHVAVISGPKPYNENLLLFVQKYAEENQLTIHCITQLAFESPYLIPVLLEQQDLILSQANTFISHIGYTTLMDLHYLNPKDVLLIPSPNQLEQEYLAKQYASKYNITITKPYSQSK